jgi:hypothetical protein
MSGINDVLIGCVDAAGGPKTVGHALWPHMDAIDAGKKLCRCLNPERAEKLSPEEVLRIIRMARDQGCHAAMEYLADTLGYSRPALAEPVDEDRAQLRLLASLGKRMAVAAEQLERRGVVLQFKALVDRFTRARA